MKVFLYLFILSLSIKLSYAQNQANFWYFSDYCGLDFKSGIPEVLHDGQTRTNLGNATISDSLGNLLFYTAKFSVFNKNHLIMDNGDGLAYAGTFGRAIVKWPGNDNLYYIFNAIHPQMNTGLFYSVVDMSLDSGLGAVTEKEIPVLSAMDAADRIAIVKKDNSEYVWVITRKYTDDAFAAYLVDENGFNPNPILCEMPDQEASIGHWGYLKLSYNKRFLFSSYMITNDIEVCSFNASDGTIQYMYTINNPAYLNYPLTGMEFSPDSKYLYIGFNSSTDTNKIYQFDMQFINDPILFNNSAIWIGSGGAFGLQLARDGKIYCTITSEPQHYYYLNVINNPWVRGVGCNYENEVLNMAPGEVEYSLPNILLDYLFRFEWEGERCQGYPIHFKPNFIPTPDSIIWNFDEFAPGSISTELSPTYSFQHPGVHEVKVDVWYPSGRYEHTSREIEIFHSPQPDLGPDTIICENALLTLNAGCDADFFSWSTGQFGVSSITVSDSGTYWVKGRFSESGCEGYDTIHIGFHPPTLIDETNLVIIPTTCSGASGSITGLAALGSPPFTYQWLDLTGNPNGTNIDATNLPAGQYQLTITDGNSCETVSNVYTIEDAGDLQVTQVQITRPHCFSDDGQIIVHAFSPSGSIMEYSIDAGVNFQSDSIFPNLFASDYAVQVRDENSCSGFYLENPIVLADIPGPQVQPPVVTDETDFLGNGSIEIIATGSTTTLYYSNDNGITYQSNNGTFNHLTAGTYICIVKDENDCDTTFTVEIKNIILTYLQVVTGEGGHCLGNTAMVPLNVDNFNNVAEFNLKMGFNVDNLQCEGYTNVQPELIDSLTGFVDQAVGEIHFTWQSPTAVTFLGTEKVADLVFTTKNPGQGEISWYTGATESYFTNTNGMPIPTEFSTGAVVVYETPQIVLQTSKTVCIGDMVNFMSIAIGNQPPIDYQWIYPAGDTTDNDPFFFSVSSTDGGVYTLLATDRVGCTDQKSIELIVSENPVAAFHGTDTLKLQTGDVLDAGAGLLSYLWNTGDTTDVINSEGMYTVELESPVGCLGSDSVYVKLVSEEIPEFEIYIPNAFSPNGDGVNDFFQVWSNGLPIFKFQISIFDRWGGEVFSSSGIDNGWDGKKNGKDCPGGVYVYKIVYSVDGVPGNQERVGTVMLVR